MPSHYLAYPADSDSTGFIENPCSGYIFNVAFCEPQQVIIDRVEAAGGIGSIAHPTDTSTLYTPWDFTKGSVGWSGLEIWTSASGTLGEADVTARTLWHHLLAGVRRPRDGALFSRPGFRNAFPVAIGNSDAHTPAAIGATFTYARMPEVTRANVADALLSGRTVASNGPLLFAEIEGAGIGEVASGIGPATSVDVTLQTTPEFGPVGDYAIVVYVDGAIRAVVPPSGSPAFSTTIEIEGLDFQLPDKYVTIQAGSLDGVHHAFTNPVWLSLPVCVGDVDDDVDVVDFVLVLLTQGACDDCPTDVTRDGVVDGADAFAVLVNLGACTP